MTNDIFEGVPARLGHFLLESGYHTDVWLTLDALFVSPMALAPQVAALAERLRPYAPTAVCGPLMGGAFLAQALAMYMGVYFYYCEPAPLRADSGLFTARYRLPPELRRRVAGEHVAVVDDAISAGSSVRATMAELDSAGATALVVGTLLLLGTEASPHFSARGIPLVALAERELNLWSPAECPLCRGGPPLEDLLTPAAS